MDQKIKSDKFVPAAAVEEGEQKTWGKKGKEMDGEFDEVVEEGNGRPGARKGKTGWRTWSWMMSLRTVLLSFLPKTMREAGGKSFMIQNLINS